MIVFASYRQSLRVRNLLFVLALLALCAVGYKLYATVEKLRYMDAAEAAFQKKDYAQAERFYKLASLPFSIQTKGAQLEDELSSLTVAREEAEALAEQLESTAAVKDPAELLSPYRHFLEIKKSYADDRPSSQYFHSIIATFELDKKWSGKFIQLKEQAYQHMQQNLNRHQFEDESFLPVLTAIPYSFFGDQDAKDKELAKRFREYDRDKFAYLMDQQEFVQVISTLYDSWKRYGEAGIEPVWLQEIAEKQGRRVLQLDLREDDLASFIQHAKDYERLFSIFSTDSEVKRLIEETMEKELGRAQSFMERNLFDKALELYGELSAYTNTSDAIDEAEKQWIIHDPMRMLDKAYPDKKWIRTMATKEKEDKEVYAIAFSDEHELFYARLNDDGSVTQYQTTLDKDLDVLNFTYTDQLLENNTFVVMIRAKGEKRSTRYLGFAVGESTWKPVLSMEADDLTIEAPGKLIVTNPLGDGEQEIAHYVWKDDQFVYDGAKEKLEPPADEEGEPANDPVESSEPSDSSGSEDTPPSNDSAPPLAENEYFLQEEALIRSGPGDDYEVMGKLEPGTVVKAIEKQDGWIKVAFDIGEYWIKLP
ncbi:SH3 domain-containing protein [Brevibacillus migulae]|uniref:SH3 domain-containing protein n=1 Tax=Brevibacillus migulae TaxID=1644114 RepID=UPI001430C16E|nr:SH3 domain-containing protein [Brevibacillus migulae]